MFCTTSPIWNSYKDSQRDLSVGYAERGHDVQEFIFNKLPSLLLISRGLTFTATGVAAAAASFTLPAVLMVGAGALFTYGAFSEYRRQNHTGVEEPCETYCPVESFGDFMIPQTQEISDDCVTIDMSELKTEDKEEEKTSPVFDLTEDMVIDDDEPGGPLSVPQPGT